VLRPLLLALPLVALESTPPSNPEATARALVDREHGVMFIDLAPTDLPAHAMAFPPIASLTVPASGCLYAFQVEMIDSAGHALPSVLLHHFNLIDPDHRELFLPISRRMLAAGRETGAMSIPWLLFGFPVDSGERIVASAMLDNPTGDAYTDARVRLVLHFVPAGRPWPLFHAEPFQMDVAFPVGDKSFDLPPGRSERSYTGSPTVPGTIVAMGGHAHQYAERLEFQDVTTGAFIYQEAPRTDSTGQLTGFPVVRLYGLGRLGVHVEPSHQYRVTVHYLNPTGQLIPDGGMGVVGGLFIPDRGIPWPATNPGDSLYAEDYRHLMRLEPDRDMMMMPGMTPGHAMSGQHAH
jgi:hypothetical protein